VVFYNGDRDMPEEQILRLSSAICSAADSPMKKSAVWWNAARRRWMKFGTKKNDKHSFRMKHSFRITSILLE
jgi:hypothetical protein